jgi:hypothetical protein
MGMIISSWQLFGENSKRGNRIGQLPGSNTLPGEGAA